MTMADYLTTKQAAKQLGVSSGRIRQFALAGRLPFEKIGAQLFFKKQHIQSFKRRPSGRPSTGRKEIARIKKLMKDGLGI